MKKYYLSILLSCAFISSVSIASTFTETEVQGNNQQAVILYPKISSMEEEKIQDFNKEYRFIPEIDEDKLQKHQDDVLVHFARKAYRTGNIELFQVLREKFERGNVDDFGYGFEQFGSWGEGEYKGWTGLYTFILKEKGISQSVEEYLNALKNSEESEKRMENYFEEIKNYQQDISKLIEDTDKFPKNFTVKSLKYLASKTVHTKNLNQDELPIDAKEYINKKFR